MRIQTDFDERDDGMKVDGKTIAGESAGIEIPGNPQNVKRKRRTELGIVKRDFTAADVAVFPERPSLERFGSK